MNLLYIGKYVRNIVVFIEFLLFLYYTNFNIIMLKKKIFLCFCISSVLQFRQGTGQAQTCGSDSR